MSHKASQIGACADFQKFLFAGQGGDQAFACPVMNNLAPGAAGVLIKKSGPDSGVAGNIVKQIFRVVMDHLKQKTNDPNNTSIDPEGVIGSLPGKGSGDIL
jgi:hypothetical protein